MRAGGPQVLDPLLAQHLAHWGINMMQMQKTDKTMTELTIDSMLKCAAAPRVASVHRHVSNGACAL
jgi:hypothetical protein